MHAFRKPPMSPSFSLLGDEAKIAAQRRNYAKSKDKKKEKGMDLSRSVASIFRATFFFRKNKSPGK